MTTSTAGNRQAVNSAEDIFFYSSLIILLLHFYVFCYSAFRDWHLTWRISDTILMKTENIGVIANFWWSKLSVLGLLILFTWASRNRKTGSVSFRKAGGYLGVGISLYFISETIFFIPDLSHTAIAAGYMSMTLAGYLTVMTGLALFPRAIRTARSRRVSNKENETFQQEERLLENDFSINFRMRYRFRRSRKGWINCINGRRGLLIAGVAGSGKSWLIIKPTLKILSKKHFTQFIYDYKYPDLTVIAYNHYLQNRDGYHVTPAFYYIDFTRPSYSHRNNPIAPAMLRDLIDALEASKSMLLSINKSWADKQGDFFVESPINFLAAVIWFLRNYSGGKYCTLPHAIELIQLEYDKLFTVLNTDPEISTLVSPFLSIYLNDVMEVLESQMASVRIPLGRLAFPSVYYILTGNDFSLDINNPQEPKIVCLGNDPTRSEALSPIISLICDRLNKMINQKGKAKCSIVYDEFATIRVSSVQSLIQVGRSNDIMPIIAIQDYSQLKKIYSREEAEALFNMAGSIICGQVNGETAKLVADRFPRILQDRTSWSYNNTDVTVNQSSQLGASVPIATISSLSSGEFVGVMADDPAQRMELKAFHAEIINDPEALEREQRSFLDLPKVRDVDEDVIKKNFMKVKQDVRDIYDDILEELENDPARAHLIVNKKKD
jgi:hypothetical protein